jgi:hypothetical protein
MYVTNPQKMKEKKPVTLNMFVLTLFLHIITKYVHAIWFVNPGIQSPNSYSIS